ncbi:MAG: diphthamide synthesis protein [Nanoarchaeota archaeon]|nr:diphthamide synthesis protein [Nanoarchaeota archaeon]MBU4116906.1 diphthamide synthesis protein [Nanoarchaeota archaeon]
MNKFTIKEVQEKYDLELDKVISQIKKSRAKLVLLQFPDGLKQYAITIVDYLSEKTSAGFLIWLESCFGACDTPVGLEKLKPKIDLVIQFGHNQLMPRF